jgi:hypothetical protein
MEKPDHPDLTAKTPSRQGVGVFMDRTHPLLGGLVVGWILFASVGTAVAHPEFQAFVRKSSGQTVNCALCHAHPDGPEGTGPGQLGSLKAAEFDRLNRARGAFEPGVEVSSPVLNAFGNSLVKRLGKARILEARSDPKALWEGMDAASDMDHDGVPDVQELREGTHPLWDDSGNPARLFWHNLKVQRFHVLMIILATFVTLFGLHHLFRGLEVSLRDHGKTDGRE